MSYFLVLEIGGPLINCLMVLRKYWGKFTFFSGDKKYLSPRFPKGPQQRQKSKARNLRFRTWILAAFWRQKKLPMVLKGGLFKYIITQTLKLYADPYILWKVFGNVQNPKFPVKGSNPESWWSLLSNKNVRWSAIGQQMLYP